MKIKGLNYVCPATRDSQKTKNNNKFNPYLWLCFITTHPVANRSSSRFTSNKNGTKNKVTGIGGK